MELLSTNPYQISVSCTKQAGVSFVIMRSFEWMNSNGSFWKSKPAKNCLSFRISLRKILVSYLLTRYLYVNCEWWKYCSISIVSVSTVVLSTSLDECLKLHNDGSLQFYFLIHPQSAFSFSCSIEKCLTNVSTFFLLLQWKQISLNGKCTCIMNQLKLFPFGNKHNCNGGN